MNASVPDRNCDIVMKGGITSGVVYPLTVVELAEEFRFKNIGGTSAGAIAAAVAAAAEYQRVGKGSSAGFARLAALPDFLGKGANGESNLLNLFPPTRSTRRLFNLFMTFIGDDSILRKSLRAIGLVIPVSPLITLGSFAPALLLLAVLITQIVRGSIDGPAVAGLLLVELFLIIMGILLTAAGNAVRAFCFTLPRNRFGFSTGRAPSDRKLPGVTDWLDNEIQATAGLSSAASPLTFGDLWLADRTVAPASREAELKKREDDPELRAINVQMITTALTHGHPYRLPFENRIFSFCESEFNEYFPSGVVSHLKAKSRTPQPGPCPNGHHDLWALPEPWDLPLVVAARMSLSFPILFTLVPLYGVDYTRKVNQPHDAAPTYDRCWFIDGGLSSNFPMSLFDSPFPRWPTFGINLDEFHPDYPHDPNDESKNVWMIKGAGSGTSARWKLFPDSGVAGIGGYIGTILDAIRNWHDNTQLAVPGFRDRIAHVKLTPKEGGLNLNMKDDKVKALSQRGKWAGTKLRERFGKAGATWPGLNWNTHRWTRVRSSLALFQKEMKRIDRAFQYTDPAYPNYNYPSYNMLLKRSANADPETGYWWDDAAGSQAAATEYVKFANTAAASAVDLGGGAPNPRPELRISPRL